MKKTTLIFSILFVLLVAGGITYAVHQDNRPGKYDNLAKCLTEKGVKFFGAFWCPHCQNEKAMFGKSKQYLPYVECSKPNREVTQVCVDNNIESYPTWIFPDGTRQVGEVKPEDLATKMSCPLN